MSWTCEQIEARLSDYLDGAVAGTERTAFEAHVGECERCAPLVAHVSQLLSGMHSMEQLEAPPRLVYSILEKPLRVGQRYSVGSVAWLRCASPMERCPLRARWLFC
jgi:anti-sigma factor RsiW